MFNMQTLARRNFCAIFIELFFGENLDNVNGKEIQIAYK